MKPHVSNNLKVLANICFNFDKKEQVILDSDTKIDINDLAYFHINEKYGSFKHENANYAVFHWLLKKIKQTSSEAQAIKMPMPHSFPEVSSSSKNLC